MEYVNVYSDNHGVQEHTAMVDRYFTGNFYMRPVDVNPFYGMSESEAKKCREVLIKAYEPRFKEIERQMREKFE